MARRSPETSISRPQEGLQGQSAGQSITNIEFPVTFEVALINRPKENDALPVFDTHIEGVGLVYKGAVPDMTKKQTKEYADIVHELIPIELERHDLQLEADPLEKRFRRITKEVDGLNGVVGVVANGRQYRFVPSVPEEVSYTKDAIDSLGKSYRDQIVHRVEAEITVVIPDGARPELFLQSMAIILDAMSVPREELAAYLNMKLKYTVDETVTRDLLAQNLIRFRRGGRTVKRGTPKLSLPRLLGDLEERSENPVEHEDQTIEIALPEK